MTVLLGGGLTITGRSLPPHAASPQDRARNNKAVRIPLLLDCIVENVNAAPAGTSPNCVVAHRANTVKLHAVPLGVPGGRS
jgi:hypothetical protein